MKSIVCLIVLSGSLLLMNCDEKTTTQQASDVKAKHHLNIPSDGIQSMMASNTQKIIEGTDGSVIIAVGEVTRKKVDISVKRDDKILDERILSEKDKITFRYEGVEYSVEVHQIKKPLIGEGKAEISIR